MITEKYKVSVIIPVYNVERYLVEALESVINQTLKEIEIILVNDGSTDKSLEIIREYEKKDARIKVINQKNQGQSVARNNGLKISNAEYVYFMDSDDYIELDTLECCYNKSKKENLDFLVFDSDIFFENIQLEESCSNFKKNREKNLEDKIEIGIDVLNKLLKNNNYSCVAWIHFIKKEFLDNIGLKFYSGIIHEDELFTYELYLNAQRVNYIKRRFFKRRLRENSTMTTPKGEKNMIGYMTVAKELEKIKKVEKNGEKKILLEVKIESTVSSCIGLLDYLDQNLQKKYKEDIEENFKDYLNLKNKIKLDYPTIFKIIKAVKERVV